MPGTVDLDRLLAISGAEHPSGPRTTVYRRWDPDDFLTADVLHRPYSNPTLRAPRLIITGLHLVGEDKQCLGLLACPNPDGSPWDGKVTRRLSQSQIYLWSRIMAIRCDAIAFGDLIHLTTYRFAEEVAALCRSKSSRKGQDVGALASRWVTHLGLDAHRVEQALELVPDLIRINQTAKSVSEADSILSLIRSRIAAAD